MSSGDKLHRCQGFGVGGAQHASLGDDGGDVLGRSYIEGRVANADSVRRELLSSVVGDFHRVALFDWDLVACHGGTVNGGPGRGNVERDAMLFGEDGDRIGTDLVGYVAVGGDAISSH